ncbi:MAG: hypothetical protein GY759_16545 [Chloroflexi bacterium]|nr:hypothetical protein [Chloroflexota bacterium]
MSQNRKRTLFSLALLAAIILLAAFYRLYQINTLPPGDGYDPAWYGVDAIDILAGERPLFLPTNFGREVMFSYLVALVVGLVGYTPSAIHIAAAIVGILTIPAMYAVAKALFADEKGALEKYGGLLAAFTLAISYWHLSWSRFGVRAILIPLFTSLTFYFLWRGFRAGKRLDYVLAGILLGLSAYTYQAARIMPVIVVLGFIFLAISRPRHRPTRTDVINLFIVGGVAFLIFLPLGAYFVTHPGSFGERINQTWAVDAEQGPGAVIVMMWERMKGLAMILVSSGEDKALYYLVGRPILDVGIAILFGLGLVLGMWRLKKPNYQFMFAWLIIMSTPAILAEGRATKRAIGILPVVILFTVIGALVPWDRISGWAKEQQNTISKIVKYGYLALLILVFVSSGFTTYRHYFVDWRQDPDLFTYFETGLSQIGQYAHTLPDDEIIYVSPVPVDHSSVVFGAQGRLGMRRYNGAACMVTPAETDVNTTYIIVSGDGGDPNSLERLTSYFPQGEIVEQGPLHYGEPYFLAYRVPAGSESGMAPQHMVSANWDNTIELIGYDLESQTYSPGDTIHLTVYFRALSEMAPDYTLSVQLLGEHNPTSNGPLWAQFDGEPCQRYYPTSAWIEDDILRERIVLTIPPETPPGSYDLHIGFYQWPSLERLQLQQGGDSLLLMPISVDATGSR